VCGSSRLLLSVVVWRAIGLAVPGAIGWTWRVAPVAAAGRFGSSGPFGVRVQGNVRASAPSEQVSGFCRRRSEAVPATCNVSEIEAAQRHADSTSTGSTSMLTVILRRGLSVSTGAISVVDAHLHQRGPVHPEESQVPWARTVRPRAAGRMGRNDSRLFGTTRSIRFSGFQGLLTGIPDWVVGLGGMSLRRGPGAVLAICGHQLPAAPAIRPWRTTMLLASSRRTDSSRLVATGQRLHEPASIQQLITRRRGASIRPWCAAHPLGELGHSEIPTS